MATDRELVDALQEAAEALIGRPLTHGERQRLIDSFNKATGTPQQRAREVLRNFTGLTEGQMDKRASASDNTDRVMDDLRNVLDTWKPGT